MLCLTICAVSLGVAMTVSETVRAATADSEIPVPLPASRYAELIKKSPFSVATPETKTAAPIPSFAEKLYISGIAEIGDKDFVSITAKGTTQSFSISEGEDSPDGIHLVKVNSSNDLAKSKVTLEKDGKTAEIGFDEQVMKADLKPVMPLPTPSPREVQREKRREYFRKMMERFRHHRHDNGNDQSGESTQTYQHSGRINSHP